jgi:hypothetical protein
MDNKDKSLIVSRLEGLEALATLFKNMWFDQVKLEIKDEKIRAYLMVFEDVFPLLNHVSAFGRQCAEILDSENLNKDHLQQIQTAFDQLNSKIQGTPINTATKRTEAVEIADPIDNLFKQEVQVNTDIVSDDLSTAEKKALAAVDQSDIDALFVSDDGPPKKTRAEDIDALFGDIPDDEVELEIDDEPGEATDTVTDAVPEVSDALTPEEDDEEESEEEEASAGISEDELANLLDDDEMPPKAKPKAKAKTKAPEQQKIPEIADDESVNQDEIDALFG